MISEILSRPTVFIACTVMWFVHGFVLDIVLICVLPFADPKKSDAERLDKFPWALGGYSDYKLVPNLGPTHRRFMTENAAYAIVRVAPIFFPDLLPVLLLCVLSYLVEALTIAWEIAKYDAPANAMLPQTLMSVFATLVTFAATSNPDGFIDSVDETVLMLTQGACIGTYLCWAIAAVATLKKTKKA